MSEIVFVTSFRDIDRGTWDTFARTKEMYVKYFLLLAQNISYSLIVYVDKKLGKELKLKCKQKNIIFQDIETVKTFYNKYLTQDQQIMQSQVYQDKIPPKRKNHPEHLYSKYNLTMHSKVNFLSHALLQFPNNAWYTWIDFGFVRSIKDVPQQIDTAQLSKNKITCHCLQKPSYYQSANDMLSSFEIYLTGGAYIVPVSQVNRLQQLYEEELLLWYNNDISDDDQSLLLQLYFKHPDLFCLKENSEWMSLFRMLQAQKNLKKIFETPCFPPTEWIPVTKSIVRVGNTMYQLPQSKDLRMLTVGTDPTSGYYRYIQSVKKFDYRVLGFGDKWDGWKQQALTGGGKKILYLKDYFDTHILPEYVVFTDCYDVVVVADEAEVMKKYKKHFDGKLVFGAEVYCWPDESLASQYPTSDSNFKYLNSGLFMGPSSLIHKYLTNNIAPTDDDQLYFTKMFFKHPDDIVLDYNGIIFQNLAGTTPQDFHHDGKGIANEYDNRPCFLHGNGPGRKTLDFLTTHTDLTIHLINLKTNPEKKKSSIKNFERFGVPYVVVNGVDGNNYQLSQHERWLFKQADYDIDVQLGVVGCCLSHLKLLEAFVRSKQSHLLVAEDNVTIVEPDFLLVIHDLISKPYSMIHLCCLHQPTTSAIQQHGKYNLYKCQKRWYGQGTRCYLISKASAVDILQKYYRGDCTRAIDWFYLDHITNPMIIYPSLCQYDGSNSAIEERGGH